MMGNRFRNTWLRRLPNGPGAPAVFLLAACTLFGAAPREFKFTAVDEKLLAEVEAVDQQFEKRGLLFTDPELQAYLDRLAQPLLAAAGTPERVRWRVLVLGDASIAAFALPNGSIYLHTGMLALLENQTQLAGILAHEITHVVDRHTYLHFRSYRKKALARNLTVAAVEGALIMPVGGAFGIALNVMSQVTRRLNTAPVFGYNREHEREADLIAVERLSAAGHNPAETLNMFFLLDERLDAEPLRTFHRDSTRILERKKYITPVLKSGAPTPVPGAGKTYLAAVEKAIRYNVQADLDSRRFRTAVARARRLADFKPNDLDNRFLLAEAVRALGARSPEPSQDELSAEGQSDARKRLIKKTETEEEKELLSRPEGRVARRRNHETAEQLYRSCIDSGFVTAWRGLGMLYQDQGRIAEAREAYRKYLDLAPGASDALRIQRRLTALEATLQPRPGQGGPK